MSFSWYSLKIILYKPEKVDNIKKDEDVIFNGYFVVDNSNALVVSVYETVRGITDTSRNLLYPTGSVGDEWDSYIGFTVYSDATFAKYDNAYLNGWKQFDNYGIVIKGLSAYPRETRFNLCAVDLGEEESTNIGQTIVTNSLNEHFQIPTTFEITELSSPPVFTTSLGSKSWYNLFVSSAENGRVLFNGYIWVNELNKVEGLFETVNGTTNFRNNFIVSEAAGSSWWGKTDSGFNISSQPTLYTYDNTYVGGWKQFDYYGIIFRGMTSYPQYNTFNFSAMEYYDETSTNIGNLVIFDDAKNKTIVPVVFNITPTSNPIEAQAALNNKRSKNQSNPNSQNKRIVVSMCGQSSPGDSYQNYLMGIRNT